MKVLFLTVSTGQGHTSCGKAIEGCLKKNGVETFFLDVYGYINPIFGKAISDIYLFASGKTPKLYGKYYDREDLGKTNFVSVVSNLNRTIKNKIEKFIRLNKIDVVICTHLFSGQLMTLIKDKVNTINIGIVTDYTIHPKWETTDLDYYVIADKSLIMLAEKKGIEKEKLLPFGIPVDLKFVNKKNKQQAKEKLGFGNKPLTFVMMGSMGYGNIASIINEIDSSGIDCDIAVVCGKNEKAKHMIESGKHKLNFKAYGYVNNVDEFMDAADCIITKPGGLSVTESLAKELPMIFIEPIPGQEDRNVEFLVNNGVGLTVSKSYSLSSAINMFFGDDIRRKEIETAIHRLTKPYAAIEISEFILSLKEKLNEA